jgi:cell division transport system permease protein
MTRRADHLGLGAAKTDRLLLPLVAAMSFLAALAIAGTLAAATLAEQWRGSTATALTVQITDPADAAAGPGQTTRLAAVLAILQATPEVKQLHQLSPAEIDTLLQPWLGADAAQLGLPLPAVITASWSGGGPPDVLRAALAAAAPGTLTETGERWAARVAALTASLQACAAAVLLIVALLAAAVVALVTRAGLAQGRTAIEIVHGLGALDSDIAGKFAGRATSRAAAGAAIGALACLPVLLWLARLASPFAGGALPGGVSGLPPALWAALPGLPVIAALIGWTTAQFTVRGWLRGLI